MIRLLIVLLFSTSLFAQDTAVRKKNLDIAIGIDEIIRFDYKFNLKIQVGQNDIVKPVIVPAKQEIIFRGLAPGKTSVTIRDTFGEVRDVFLVNVTSDGNSNIVRELRELIGDIEGIEIKIAGGKVVVGGEIVVPEEYGRIMSVLSRYPDVLVLIQYSRQTQLIIAREMQDAINRNNMKDVTVRVVNGDYWLEGIVNSEGKKILAENIANAYLPDKLNSLGASAGGARVQIKERGNVVPFISVNEKKDPEPPKKLVKVSSQFVELTKDYAKVFAFKWAPFISSDSSINFGKVEGEDGTTEGGITTRESGTLAGTITRLFPQLNSAKSAGYARVLQAGMGVTNDKSRVSVQKTTEINFAVGTGQGQEAQKATVTFTMTTTPTIGTQENINLDPLTVNVSLNSGNAGSGPLVTRNEVSTAVTVKSKESAVIGGIMQNSSTTNYDKDDPDNTVAAPADAGDSSQQASQLFRLLRSKNYSTQKTQFVVFVTPEILESASKGTEEIRRKFRKRER